MIKQYPESSFLPNLDSDTFLKIFFLESIREFCADEVDGTFKLNKPPDPETSGGFQKNGYDGGGPRSPWRVRWVGWSCGLGDAGVVAVGDTIVFKFKSDKVAGLNVGDKVEIEIANPDKSLYIIKQNPCQRHHKKTKQPRKTP